MRIDWQAEAEKMKDELLSKTQELLQIPSVLDPSSATTGAPFGTEVARALDYMLALARKNEMRSKNLDGYIGYAEFGAGEEMVGVLCHVDVVPAGDGWSSPPFAAEIVQDRVIARGALDDKGPTMAAFFAAKLVKELGLPLKRRVRLIFGADEESDWQCVERYFREEEMPTFGFAPDADFPLIHAEKGMFNVTIGQNLKTAPRGPIQLVHFHAGVRPNMVPDEAKALLRFESEGRLQQVCERFQQYLDEYGHTGEYTVDGPTCTFIIHGKSAHGSTPERGVHAGWVMARFLDLLPLDERGSAFVRVQLDCFVDDPFAVKLGIATVDEEMGELTINVGMIRYETEGNGEAKLVLNIRYPANTNADQLREKLVEGLTNYNCAIIDEDSSLTPHHVAKDHPFVQTLLRIYEKHTHTKAEPLAIGGATYARSLDVGVAFGPLFPDREDTAHQKNEYILIDDLLKATAIYAEAIYELANM